MSSPPPSNDSDVLDGWKQIADYLGKSVRTAQRWRQEFGMPVYRLGGREGENVYAFRSDLDAWRRQASHVRGFAASEPHAGDPPEAAGNENATRDARRSRRARVAWAVGSVALLASLGYAGWKAIGPGRGTDAPTAASPADADRQPARWAVVGDRFHAYNAAGEELWTYHPGPALNTSQYHGHTDPARLPLPDLATRISVSYAIPPVFIGDIDGDGRREVLLIAYPQDPVEGSTLHCLDAGGRLRWTFRAGDALVFGGEDYGLPTRMPWVTSSSDARGAVSLWLSAEHQTWFPTWVYRLDSSGRVLGRYGSSGRVNKLRFVSTGSRQYALLGGVSNEHRTAAVAVVDVARFGGAAPAATPKYRCGSCTPGVPDHYLIFPPTDVSPLTGGMPVVAEFAVHPSGEIVVSVKQHAARLPGEDGDTLALTNYRLDPAFRVRDAEYFSQYVTVHDFYASAGRLTHRFDPRRDGPQLWPVLRWNGSGYDRVERPER